MPDFSSSKSCFHNAAMPGGFFRKHLFIFIFVIIIILSFVLVVDLYYVSPRYETDYFVQYNEITKPIDYNPADNAWPNLRQAFRWLPEPPDDIKPFLYLWPKDINEVQLKMIRDWVSRSGRNISYLNHAAAKKYVWYPYLSTSAQITDSIRLESRHYIISNQLMITKAILQASQGEPDSAFRTLEDIYKISFFLSGGKTVMEQLLGIYMRAAVLDAAIEIAAYADPNENVLENFPKNISRINAQYPAQVSFEAEKVVFLDAAQKGFTDRKQGVLGMGRSFIAQYGLDAIKISRQNTMATFEKTLDYINGIIDKIPYELMAVQAEEKLKEITQKNIFVDFWSSSYLHLIELSHRSKMHSDALILILALQRHKIKTGAYPDSLSVLQQAGYINKIPLDVYSGKPLVYKKTDDNFILYSYAADVDDDGGEHSSRWARNGNGDYVFWPIQEIFSGGIIYR